MIRIMLLSGPLPIVGATQYDHDYIVLSRIMDLPLKQTLAYPSAVCVTQPKGIIDGRSYRVDDSRVNSTDGRLSSTATKFTIAELTRTDLRW